MNVIQRISNAFRGKAISNLTTRELARHIRNGGQTASGAYVSESNALTVSAVYACVGVLSQTIAQIPLHLMRTEGRRKSKAIDHPLYEILHLAPNELQTSFEFLEMQMASLALNGNAYALRTQYNGKIKELLPISPNSVQINRHANWRISYTVTLPDGARIDVPAARMLHIRGLSLDGIQGISPISYHRETVGIAMQLSKHAATMFKNGAQVGGILTHPKVLDDEAARRLKESFDEQYSGADNAHKTLLLEDGLTFTKTGMSAQDTQYLEQRKFQKSDIASLFRVPPHMINDLERATFSNIEHQSLSFVKFTMMPWIRRIEQKIATQLLDVDERRQLEPKFVVAGLERGDYKTRTAGYQSAISTGWMSRNEARELEDMDTVEGLDEYFSPLNMGTAGYDDKDDDEREDKRDEK